MLDFRNQPGESPLAWCAMHRKLVRVDSVKNMMTTAYHLTKYGVFPYAVCDGTCIREEVPITAACKEQMPIG